jgi:hypothetical protein
MSDSGTISMKSYGDLQISQTEHGDLRLEQENHTSIEPAVVIVAKEQLATLVAFIRQVQPEGARS